MYIIIRNKKSLSEQAIRMVLGYVIDFIAFAGIENYLKILAIPK